MNTLEERCALVSNHITHLNNCFFQLPDFIKQEPWGMEGNAITLMTTVVSAQRNLLSQLESKDKTKDTLETTCLRCEDLLAQSIITLSNAIEKNIRRIHDLTKRYELVQKYQALLESVPALQKSYEEKANVSEEIVKKFINHYLDLVKEVKQSIEAPAEKIYKAQKQFAAEECSVQFPIDKYPYQLYPGDLRKSQNLFIQDVIKITGNRTIDIEDENSYILQGKIPDNLHQIKKDADRNLTIAGQKEKDKEEEILSNLLTEKFGQKNAENIIRHYDQGVSFLVGGVISQGASTDNIMEQNVSIRQPEDIYQGLYRGRGDLVYRNAEIKEMILFIKIQTNNQEITEHWKFKVNVKVLSHSLHEGFTVDRMGTDSAFICRTLMRQDNYALLEALVTAVFLIKKDLIMQLTKLKTEYSQHDPKSSAYKNKQGKYNFIFTALTRIKEFTQGKITFEELIDKINDLKEAIKNLPHIHPLRQAAAAAVNMLVGISTTAHFFQEISTKLEAIQAKVYGGVQQYDRRHEPPRLQHASDPYSILSAAIPPPQQPIAVATLSAATPTFSSTAHTQTPSTQKTPRPR